MKHLILQLSFFYHYTVAVRAQIVFPTPNQVEMQTGNLILGKKVSMYAEDTTAFYLNLFEKKYSPALPSNGKKRIQSRYLLDNRLIPAPRRLPDQDSSATDGNQRPDKGGFTYAATNATPMGSRFSRIYHLCLRKRDGPSLHTVALLLTGLRTSVPEDCHHQKVYRHGFTAQNELLPLASDRRTGMAHRNQAISAPHPDWRFGRQRRRTAGILYTGRNTGTSSNMPVNGISPSSPK